MPDSGALPGQSYPTFAYVGGDGYYMVFTEHDGAHTGPDVFSDGPRRWFVWPGGTEPYPTREAAARASWEAGLDG